MPNDLPIHGKKTKPYELWRLDIEDSKRERVASADTIEELSTFKRRPDWKYGIFHRGELIQPPRKPD
jgi:hypothetical protein